MNTIIGVFNEPAAARRAVDALHASSLSLDDVSVVARSDEEKKVVTGGTDDVSAGQGAAVGAVWGGLVGLGALLIPGVGPFIALGALGAALTGVVTGAVVGGITAGLVDFSGMPEDDARAYETMVTSGKTLVAVKARDEDSTEVHRILTSAGADSVQDDAAATMGGTTVAMYDEQGKRVGTSTDSTLGNDAIPIVDTLPPLNPTK